MLDFSSVGTITLLLQFEFPDVLLVQLALRLVPQQQLGGVELALWVEEFAKIEKKIQVETITIAQNEVLFIPVCFVKTNSLNFPSAPQIGSCA